MKALILAIGLTVIFGCKGKSSAEKMSEAQAMADSLYAGKDYYACPMHPEIMSDQPGKCSKCGMALKLHKHGAEGKKFKMTFNFLPTEVEAGQPVTLSLKPVVVDDAHAIVPLEMVHEKKIHLIVVSDDLSYFDHIHPEYQASGDYTTEAKFPFGGKFVLFADYKPVNGDGQVERIGVDVKGTPKKNTVFTSEKLMSNVDGYEVSLQAEGQWQTQEAMHITGIIKQSGKEISANQLDDYLGAKAHMVIIGVSSKAYLHVHPEVENGQLDLHTAFDEPGMYRGWLQFQISGKVHTADFVIKVEASVTKGDEKKDSHDEPHKH